MVAALWLSDWTKQLFYKHVSNNGFVNYEIVKKEEAVDFLAINKKVNQVPKGPHVLWHDQMFHISKTRVNCKP